MVTENIETENQIQEPVASTPDASAEVPASQPIPETVIPTPSEPILEPAIPAPQASEKNPVEQPPAPPASQPTLTPPSPQNPKSFLSKAIDAIRFRKKAKLEKIVKLAQTKSSITNDDVQKLVRVSDATATRYLSELVRQNRLKRVGKTTTTRYEPI